MYIWLSPFAETITVLLIGYIPIQNKNPLKKKKKDEFQAGAGHKAVKGALDFILRVEEVTIKLLGRSFQRGRVPDEELLGIPCPILSGLFQNHLWWRAGI